MITDTELPKVSIIIPFYKNQKYLDECLLGCSKLDYPNYEIIVVSNTPLNLKYLNVKVVVTDKVATAYKDDIGVAEASGKIIAFIDDDAYPDRNWLKNAVKYFADPSVAAVGGPGITPENDSFMQKAGGAVYSSFLGTGSLNFRYFPKRQRYTDDLPNLIVRKSVIQEVDGFTTHLRSGEDSLFCLKLVKANKRILYAPDIILYHHRRHLFIPHLRQVMNYSVHRGFFAKRFPKTSLKTTYMLPPIFLALFISGIILSFTSPLFGYVFQTALVCYILAGFISVLWQTKNLAIAALASVGIPLTHLTYGIGFFKGLLTKELGEIPSY